MIQMYKLIEQYQVPTPPEDFAVFATMKPSITAVRNAIDKSVGDRETSIKQFCLHLGRDLEELNNEVNEVKLLAQVSGGRIFPNNPSSLMITKLRFLKFRPDQQIKMVCITCTSLSMHYGVY